MNQNKKVGVGLALLLFALLCIGTITTIYLAIAENKSDEANAKSLNKTPYPYLIKEYGNGVYLIKINPAQYRYDTEELLIPGLAEMKGKCNIISFEPLVRERAFGIIVTTSGACKVATVP